jgi:hypothetical protein
MYLFQVVELMEASKPAIEKSLTSQPDDPSGSVLITVLFVALIFSWVLIYFLVRNLIAGKKGEPAPAASSDLTDIKIQLNKLEVIFEAGLEGIKDLFKISRS